MGMSTRIRHLVVLLAAAVAIVAGCGTQHGTEPGSGGRDTRPADGTYVARSATVDGADRPLVPGSQITMTIKGAAIGLNAGCNHMSGDGTWNGSTLTLDPLAMTEMACAEPLMAQDDWLAGLFEVPVQVAVDGDTFTVTSGTTVLHFGPQPEPATADLLGTHWTLNAISDAGGEDGTVSTVPQGVIATLFITDGTGSFGTGCNTGSAQVTREGSHLTFDLLAVSKRPCDANSGPVESAVMTVLTDDSLTWSVTGESLTLSTTSGRSLTYLVDHGLEPEPVPATIDGATWQLTTIADLDGDSTGMLVVPDQVSATLETRDGKGLLSTGCNAGGAQVSVQGEKVRVDSIRMTKMACHGAAGEIEKKVLAIVHQGDLTWSLHDGELRLRSKHGDHELIYHAVPAAD